MPGAKRSDLFRHEASAGLCLSAKPLYAHHYRRKTELTRRTLVGWIFGLVWLMALPAWAVEYRLQVTNSEIGGVS